MENKARGNHHRVRAVGIVVQDDSVALIRREHSDRGKRYFLFPGGGVEIGESIEHAVRRETFEELGLVVIPVQLIAVVNRNGSLQYHYRVSVTGGEFGTGVGPEMSGEYHPSRGTYTAVWMKIVDLLSSPVYPRCVSELIVAAERDGWPQEPPHLIDNEQT